MSMKIKNFYKTIILTFIVIILSTLPGSSFNSVNWYDFPHKDKLGHFLMYSVLAYYFSIELLNISEIKVKNIKFIALPIIFTLGGILEIVQGTLIPFRSCDFFDFLSNTAGAIFGFVIFAFRNLKYRQTS